MQKKNPGFLYTPFEFTGIPALTEVSVSQIVCIQHSLRTNNLELQFCFLAKSHISLTSFFVFVFELYTAALLRCGAQRRYGWKPCTLWFCPLPNALAAGWGAAAGCAVGAPYVAVGWLGSAKLWPKAARSCPYPEEEERHKNFNVNSSHCVREMPYRFK